MNRNDKEITLRDKLYAAVSPEQRDDVDRLFAASICGSDRIEGIYRPLSSYLAKSPRDLPRTPRDQR